MSCRAMRRENLTRVNAGALRVLLVMRVKWNTI